MAYTSLSVPAAEAMANAFGNLAKTAALMIYSPRTTSGFGSSMEVTGGTYARVPLTWTPGGEDGQVTTQATFSVPAGTTVAGIAFLDASGKHIASTEIPEQKFSVNGQLTVTSTYRHADKFDA